MTRLTLVALLLTVPLVAAPVPKGIKKPPPTAWGDPIDGLQAGLRMPDGTSVRAEWSGLMEVVVRNVSDKPIPVRYSEQGCNLQLTGERTDTAVVLVAYQDDPVRGPVPKVIEETLKPGDELVRWLLWVPIAEFNPETRRKVCPPAGVYTFEMKQIRGDINKFGGPGRPAFDRLSTGTLEVTLK